MDRNQSSANQSSAAVDNTVSTRRVFHSVVLSGLAALVLPGCKGTEEQTSESEKPVGLQIRRRLSFEELVQKLDQTIGVRESQKLGDMTVILLTDRHVEQVRVLNSRRIELIEDLFDLELLGLESYVTGPGSEIDRKVSLEIEKSLEIDQSKLLIIPGSQEDSNGRILLDQPEYGSYTGLFKAAGFETIGLEDPELYARAAPGALAEEIYDAFITCVMEGYYMPLAAGEKKVEQLLLLEHIQKHYGSDFPQFDVSRIQERIRANEAEVILLSEKDQRYIGQLAVQFKQWFLSNAVIPRNEPAINKLISRMKEKGFQRAAMIFGRDHTIGHAPFVEGAALQQHLVKRNVSYIVLDFDGRPSAKPE